MQESHLKAFFSVDSYLHPFKKRLLLLKLTSEKEELKVTWGLHIRTVSSQWVTSPILQHLSNDQSGSVITCTLCYLSVWLTYAFPLSFLPGGREVLIHDHTFNGKSWRYIRKECCLRIASNVAANLTEIGWGTEKHLDYATCNICHFWHQPSAQKIVCLTGENKARK